MEGGDAIKRKPCAKCRARKKKVPGRLPVGPILPCCQAPKGLPEDQRAAAASSMVSEADARMKYPVNGCIGEINRLQAEAEMLPGLLTECEADVAHLKALVETSQTKTDPRPNDGGSRLPPA